MSYIVKKVTDREGCFRLVISWLDDSFSLLVLKGNKAYSSIITYDHLENQSKLLKQDFSLYCTNLKQYFQERNDNVCICFKEVQRILEINYVIGSGSSVKYFSSALSENDYCNCVENTIDSLDKCSADALLQSNILQKENALLKNELNKYKVKIEEFVKEKKLSDEKLLSHFVLLLNEKKSKIQYLTELLEALKSGRETNNPSIEKVKKPNKRSRGQDESNKNAKNPKREVISSSESEEDTSPKEEDYDSEEEKRKKLNELLAVPSTSKADFSFLKEDTPPKETEMLKPITNKIYSIDSSSVSVTKSNCEATTVTEQVVVSSTLDFNTQDMLDEL